MNVKPVSHCPKCNAVGEVIKREKQFVTLDCPKCSRKWKTLSKICPKCIKPNGYAVEGVCSGCYSEHHRSI